MAIKSFFPFFLSLFPCFSPSLSTRPTSSPHPSLFFIPSLVFSTHTRTVHTHMHKLFTHTHPRALFYFITRVHSPSRSISNPPTGSSFSAAPLLSFILYSLPPPPSLPLPLPFLSLSLSRTHTCTHTHTHTYILSHKHTDPSIFSNSTSGRLWFPLSEIAFSISLSLIMSPAKGVVPPECQFFNHFFLLLNNSPFPGNNNMHIRYTAM